MLHMFLFYTYFDIFFVLVSLRFLSLCVFISNFCLQFGSFSLLHIRLSAKKTSYLLTEDRDHRNSLTEY